MLARSAQGLYWMSRYLERAEHLCRMLRMQTEILVDRPLREIHFGWIRIYGSIGRQPLRATSNCLKMATMLLRIPTHSQILMLSPMT